MQLPTSVQAPWTVVPPLPAAPSAPPRSRHYVGDGRDILLQGFHWRSHHGSGSNGHRRSWYRIIQENSHRIKMAGFTFVWFPPPSDSLSPDGYIPRRWSVLDTAYGSQYELREAVTALHPVKALADVVVNHRVGVATAGADFEDPRFPDNRAAVARDDSSGAGTGNPDSGEERMHAARELDHSNPDVRAAVKEHLRRLRTIGFAGWRYDLVKGFHGRYVAEYNDASAPEFSVGEYFDGERQKLVNWIDRTGGKSAAFDFPNRFRLYEACTTDDYAALRSTNCGRVVPNGLLGLWPSHTVTFVDNHDTEHSREDEHRRENKDIHHFHDKTVALGYAYTLTHPGIPCVYWPHFFDWDEYTRRRIETLLHLRKNAGIHSRSEVIIREARKGLYAAQIDGRVAVKMGTQHWHPGGDWHFAVDGDKFTVWARK